MKKRLLALLLTLSMVLSLAPHSALAANGGNAKEAHDHAHELAVENAKATVTDTKTEKTGTVLAFTSDTHNGGGQSGRNNTAANRLETWINKVIEKYGGIDVISFGGDMGSAYTSGDDFWTYSKNAMDKVPSGVTQVHTTGNHEMSNGSFSSTTNVVKNNYKVGEIGEEGDNYVIYCLGSTSGSQEYTYTTAVDNDQVEKLTSFLGNEDGSRVIFIITHFPLHYTSSRKTNNADKVIDALNTAANAGKTIVYLWGHNHTDSDSYYDQIYGPDTNLQYSSSNSTPIKFYYGAAGCMSDSEYGGGSAYVKGKGLVVQIENTRSKDLNLTFDYLNESGTSVVENGTVQNASVSVKSVSTFVQTDTLEAGQTYIIASEADSDGNVLLLSSEGTGTPKQLKGVSATVSNNTITISDDEVLSKVLFNCIEDSSSSLGGLQLENGNSYLYSSNNAGLSMHALDAGRCWHYKAYDEDTDKHILWLIKEGDSNGADGYSSAGGVYKYYLDYSSGTYFTDGHVDNNYTVKDASNLPKVYLYTEAPEGDTYTLSYDANGGTGSMSSQTNKTTYTVKTNSFEKEGYEFTKWNTKADGTGTNYEPGDSITLTEDTTLYAQWTKATTVDHTVYVLTSSLTVGKKYLIVNTNAATDTNGAHAISNSNSTVVDDPVTVNAGIAATNSVVYIDSDDVEAGSVWTVGGSSTSPTFAQGSSYLYPSSSGSVSINTTSRAWSASTSSHYLRYGSTTRYYLNYNNGWRMTSSSSSSTYQVYFYEESSISVSITPSITVEPETATVGVGDTKTLTATPKNVEGTPTVTWSSNNTGVATVDQTGVVTGVATGTATITASMTYEGETYTDTCVVTVKQVNTLSYDYIGEAVTGTAYVIVSNGYALVNNNGAVAAVPATVNGNTVTLLDDEYAEANMLWTIGEDGSLSNNGVYARRASGSDETALTLDSSTATSYTNWSYTGEQITVYSTNASVDYYMYYSSGWKTSRTANGTTKLYGRTVAVTSITLPETAAVTVGGTIDLTATILPENATNKTLTWNSADETIATVDDNGKVTGVAAGTTTITATTVNGFTATCSVTVSIVPVDSVTLNKTTAEVMEGKTLQLTATVLPENATDKTVTWTSSNPAIASVDQTGKVTGVAMGGPVTITATAGSKSATCEVTVIEYVAPTGYVILIDGYALSNVHDDDNELVNSTNYHYKGLKGVEYTDIVANDPPASILWTITETTGGYFIQDAEGNYLNAVYTETSNPTGCNADLKVDSVQDYWILEGTLEDWQIDGSTLKSHEAGKSMTYEESVPIFTVRSTGENSTIEDPAHPITTETRYIEVSSFTDNKNFIIAVTKDDGSVYALKNTNGTISAETLDLAIEGEDTFISTSDTGVIWKFGVKSSSSTSKYLANNSSYLTVGNSSLSMGSTGSAVSYSGTKLQIGSRYLRYNNGFTTTSTNTNSGTDIRLFQEKKVVTGPSITLDKSAMTVPLGETGTLTATIKNVEGNPEITWTSSNDAVATVNNGVVSGLTVGKVRITAKITVDGTDYSATCEVTVKQVNTLTYDYVEETESGKTYVIVSNGYALVNNNGAVAAVPATVSGNTVTLLDDEYAEADMLWTLGEDGSFKNGDYYVRRDSGNNKDLLLSTESPSSNAGYMCFTYDGDYITVVSTSSQGSGTVFYIFYDSGWKSSSTQPDAKTKLYGEAVVLHEHTYDEPAWRWNEDYTAAMATFTCTAGDDTQTVTDNAPVEILVSAATCTADKVVKYTASVTFNGAQYTTESENVTVTGTATNHTYGTPTWSWAEGYASATATFTCAAGDDTQSVTDNAPAETLVSAATCTADKVVTYTATVTFNGNTYTDITENVSISGTATGHSYGQPAWSWNADHTVATATFTCTSGDDTQVLQDNAPVEVLVSAATCTADRVVEYTAKVTFKGTEYTTTSENVTLTGTASGHAYGQPTWSWAEGYASATASFTCSVCGDVQTVTDTSPAEILVSAASCTADKVVKYTAKVTFKETEYTAETDNVTIANTATDHTWGAPEWTWDGVTAASAKFTCSVCNHTETVNAQITSAQGTGEDLGYTVYTATVAFNNQQFTSTTRVINQYTLTFKDGETVIDTITADYGTAITAPTPTKAFYKFTGWDSEVPATMPAENKIFTAQWQAKDTYYVVGSMNNWTVSEAYELTVNPDNAGEYSGSVALAEGDEIKVVRAVAGVKVDADHYPSSEHPGYNNTTANYVVDSYHAGNVTLYFRPAGNFSDQLWQTFGGYFYIEGDHIVTVEVTPEGSGTAYVTRPNSDTATSTAPNGMMLTVHYEPSEDYQLDKIEILKEDGTSAGVTLNNDSFTMPNFNVTVKVTFKAVSWAFDKFVWSGDDTNGYTAAASYNGSNGTTKTVNATVVSNTTAATCTTAGETVYTASVTGESSLDGLPHEATKTVAIAALGHDLKAHAAVEATCTESGNSAYCSCERCGKYFSDAAGENEIEANSWVINALGHNWSEWTQTKVPTCTEKGEETRTCSRCNEKETRDVDALGHNMTVHAAVAATCTEPGNSAYWSCDRCGKFFSDANGENEIAENSWVINALGHNWSEWSRTKDPTCTEKGEETRTCSRCNEKETQEIDALGHHMTAHAAVEATCTTAGNSAYWSCDRCSKYFSDEAGENEIEANSWVINALGHDWSEWTRTKNPTCTEEGEETRTCSRCNAKETREVGALGHNMTEHPAVAPTCTTAGNSAYWSCDRCGKYFSDAEGKNEIAVNSWVIPALDHEWGEPTFEWATDFSKVTATFTCTRDTSHKEYETISEGITSEVTTPATTTSTGIRTYTVTFQSAVNGKTYTQSTEEIIPILSTYTISGSVKSWTSNDTSAEAKTVTLTLSKNGEVIDELFVTTTEDTYSFINVVDGTYSLTVTKKDHAPRTYEVVVNGSNVTQNVEIRLWGDVNGDGKVSTIDAALANWHVQGTKTITDEYTLLCADVVDTGDGVKTSDVGRINQHARKLNLLW